MTALAASAVGAPRRLREDAGGLGLAFLVALALHAGLLAFLAARHRDAALRPPGHQEITIDLAPQMVEAPTLAPVETSRPAGAPAETRPVEPPAETVAALPVTPEAPAEIRPAELVAVPPPPVDAAVSPPPPARPEAAPEPARPIAPAPAIEAVPEPAPTQEALPADAAPIPSTAVEAPALPLPLPAEPVPPTAVTALPPEPASARALPEPKPVRKPPPKAEPIPKERPRPTRQAALPGAAGASHREAASGASSRENTGGAAAAASDPNALARYAAQLAAALKARLRYPEAARAAGARGVATLRFSMNRSGRVLSAAIARSTGNPALDQAALATAAPGSMLPAAPADITQAVLTISVPLRFEAR